MFQWISPNYEYRYVNLWPRPLQQPHPPVYIPGAGSSETMKFCAERRYTYMSVYAPARVVRRWFDGYRQAAADLGYVPDPEKIAFSVPVYVADTDERAHREARPALEWLFHQGLKMPPQIHNPPGYMSPSSLRGLLMAGMKPFPGGVNGRRAGDRRVGRPGNSGWRRRHRLSAARGRPWYGPRPRSRQA